jgi:hypothetical protein
MIDSDSESGHWQSTKPEGSGSSGTRAEATGGGVRVGRPFGARRRSPACKGLGSVSLNINTQLTLRPADSEGGSLESAESHYRDWCLSRGSRDDWCP